jgi:hypothetical protein
MIEHETLLVTLVKLVGRIPLPPLPATRQRGRPPLAYFSTPWGDGADKTAVCSFTPPPRRVRLPARSHTPQRDHHDCHPRHPPALVSPPHRTEVRREHASHTAWSATGRGGGRAACGPDGRGEGCVNLHATRMKRTVWVARPWVTPLPAAPTIGRTQPDEWIVAARVRGIGCGATARGGRRGLHQRRGRNVLPLCGVEILPWDGNAV